MHLKCQLHNICSFLPLECHCLVDSIQKQLGGLLTEIQWEDSSNPNGHIKRCLTSLAIREMANQNHNKMLHTYQNALKILTSNTGEDA